jgi:hypothetical protein
MRKLLIVFFIFLSVSLQGQSVRVSANYSSISLYGAELIDQVNWCVTGLAYWNEVGTGWTGDNSKISNTGSTGANVKYTFWEIGKTYKVTCTITRTSGDVWYPYDGTGGDIHVGSVSETVTYNFVPTTTNLVIYSAAFNGSLTALSIKQVLYP